jgi:hypothetical protein
MDKPEYIQRIENKSGEFLSVVNLGEISGNSINETNYELLYINSKYVNDKVYWTEKVLKTKHVFYLYLNRGESINIDIYHRPEQLNELIIFIKQFIKQNK